MYAPLPCCMDRFIFDDPPVSYHLARTNNSCLLKVQETYRGGEGGYTTARNNNNSDRPQLLRPCDTKTKSSEEPTVKSDTQTVYTYTVVDIPGISYDTNQPRKSGYE